MAEYKITGELERVEGFLDGTFRVSFLTRQKPELEALKGKPVEVSVREKKGRRSLDANGYYWSLITRLAETMGISKPCCHNTMLRRYGQLYVDGDCPFLAVIPETEDTVRMVEEATLFHLLPTSQVRTGGDGKLYRTYRMIRGSHDYNTYEMSKLIEGVVSECKEVGIETMTPAEIERMMKTYEPKK